MDVELKSRKCMYRSKRTHRRHSLILSPKYFLDREHAPVAVNADSFAFNVEVCFAVVVAFPAVEGSDVCFFVRTFLVGGAFSE